MRVLFLGDVVGRSGRDAVTAGLPKLRADLRADLVVVNGENASHGLSRAQRGVVRGQRRRGLG